MAGAEPLDRSRGIQWQRKDRVLRQSGPGPGRQGKRTALADLDVVNPYFRSRERRDLLSHEGVRLIATSQACVDADVPAMPAEVNVLFQDQDLWGVLDIGRGRRRGTGTGPISAATAGVPMPGPICPQRPRPQTRDVEGALASLEEIQAVTGLRVTGLVDNTHLCRETELADLEAGAAWPEQFPARPACGGMPCDSGGTDRPSRGDAGPPVPRPAVHE